MHELKPLRQRPSETERVMACLSEGVQIQLGNGRSLQGAMLLGADGARSEVAQHLGLARPSYAGYSAYRSVVLISLSASLTADQLGGQGRQLASFVHVQGHQVQCSASVLLLPSNAVLLRSVEVSQANPRLTFVSLAVVATDYSMCAGELRNSLDRFLFQVIQ